MTSTETPIAGALALCQQGAEVDGGVTNRPPPLRLNFSWTILGNGVYMASQWGILMLLARLGNPETVGRFSLGLAITAPIMLFASLSLRAVQATDARSQFEFRDYAGLRVCMTLLAACTIIGISGSLYRGETALTIAAFGLSKGIESLSDVVYGFWQQQERMDLIAKSLILRGVLALIAAIVFFRVGHTVWAAVCGMATSWAVVFAVFDLRRGMTLAHHIHQTIFPRFSINRMVQLVRLSLPLGIVSMLLSFNANVPRYMISHFRSVRDLGIFSALCYVHMAGTMIVVALGQSATPRLAVYAAQGRSRDFQRLSGLLLLIGLTLGISGVVAAVVLGPRILTLLYGPEYAQSQLLFVWLTVAAGASYVAAFAGASLTAARHFRVQLPLFAIVTILTLALCFVLVRSDGAVGAAKALTATGLIQLAATLAILRAVERHRSRDIS